MACAPVRPTPATSDRLSRGMHRFPLSARQISIYADCPEVRSTRFHRSSPAASPRHRRAHRERDGRYQARSSSSARTNSPQRTAGNVRSFYKDRDTQHCSALCYAEENPASVCRIQRVVSRRMKAWISRKFPRSRSEISPSPLLPKLFQFVQLDEVYLLAKAVAIERHQGVMTSVERTAQGVLDNDDAKSEIHGA